MEQTGKTERRAVIGVTRETAANERRVALIPDAVKRYVAAGHTVMIERGAGVASSYTDDAYTAGGATLVDSAEEVYQQADLILRVQRPDERAISQMRPGTMLIGFLSPMLNAELVTQLRDQDVTALSMDAVPRISRAQSMDALSSQATVGGYKAVLLAADNLPKFFPLLMTAAGTIPPAKVVVLGAGVAGLQAIATARRLGAKVKAYDFRPVVKEQVMSLGAQFIEIDTGESGEGKGGYAREAGADTLSRQQSGLAPHIAEADVVITTAAVPGRPAPRLIPTSTVERMPKGAVIVDLAAESGGNCELTKPGEIVEHKGVKIMGLLNLPSQMPFHASQMYSKNLQNLIELIIGKDGMIKLNLDDEIIAGATVTHQNQILHEGTRKAMGLSEPPTPPPAPQPQAAAEAGSSQGA
jgi:NAD(P) transhydrogenase subunit alpha